MVGKLGTQYTLGPTGILVGDIEKDCNTRKSKIWIKKKGKSVDGQLNNPR